MPTSRGRDRVLEPSAGMGDILDAIRQAHPDVDLAAVEKNHTLRDVLAAKGYEETVAFADFLTAEGEYDKIVMNPPFEQGADIDHVRHAYDLLAEGGRVVSVMCKGPFFRSDAKSCEFRDWLDGLDSTVEDLPEDAFQGVEAFRQTGVANGSGDHHEMNRQDSLAQALNEQHQADMIRRAELIRDWRLGAERHEQAEIHVRLALHECPTRIDDATRYRIYSILSFVFPDDCWREGDQVPTEVLEQEAAWEIEYQKQLEQRSCPECGDGFCSVEIRRQSILPPRRGSVVE